VRLIITGPIKLCYSNDSEPQVGVSVVRKVDNAVYWMNLSDGQRNRFPSNIYINYGLQDNDLPATIRQYIMGM